MKVGVGFAVIVLSLIGLALHVPRGSIDVAARVQAESPAPPSEPAMQAAQPAPPPAAAPARIAEPVPTEQVASEPMTTQSSVDAKRAQRATLTAGESAMLAMYDAVAAAFEKEGDDCDAKGDVLADIITRSRDGIAGWAAEEAQSSAAQREQRAQRLNDAAGPRIARAQDMLRSAMGACQDSTSFQQALAKLAALSPVQ